MVKKELKAFLALRREDIKGTVDADMPYGVPQIDLMDDSKLTKYFYGRVAQANIGLPGSGFVPKDQVIAANTAGIRSRTLTILKFDITYALKRGREIPQEVVDFVKGHRI